MSEVPQRNFKPALNPQGRRWVLLPGEIQLREKPHRSWDLEDPQKTTPAKDPPVKLATVKGSPLPVATHKPRATSQLLISWKPRILRPSRMPLAWKTGINISKRNWRKQASQGWGHFKNLDCPSKKKRWHSWEKKDRITIQKRKISYYRK